MNAIDKIEKFHKQGSIYIEVILDNIHGTNDYGYNYFFTLQPDGDIYLNVVIDHNINPYSNKTITQSGYVTWGNLEKLVHTISIVSTPFTINVLTLDEVKERIFLEVL